MRMAKGDAEMTKQTIFDNNIDIESDYLRYKYAVDKQSEREGAVECVCILMYMFYILYTIYIYKIYIYIKENLYKIVSRRNVT